LLDETAGTQNLLLLLIITQRVGGWNLLTKMPEIGLVRVFTFSVDFRHRSNREPGTDSVPRELPRPQHRPEHGAEGGASPDILLPPPPTARLRSLIPIRSEEHESLIDA